MNALSAMLTKTLGAGGPGDIWVQRGLRLVLPLLAAVLMLAALAGQVSAKNDDGEQDSVQSGSLLVQGKDGAPLQAIRLGTDVDLTVSGPTVRGKITQAFRNPTKQWVEAVYLYPMPEDGAVDSLKLVVGDRVIVGEIKPKAQAREIYETAKADGQKAGLIEQQRPNMFTTAVANVGPGETVLVQIEYQAPVRQSSGVYSLRVPLVVGPRYNPGVRADGSDPVPDRAVLEAPVILDPRVHGKTNPVSITVHLQPGFSLGDVSSSFHAINNASDRAGGRTITLKSGDVPADRDFELTWKPSLFAGPQASLFRETIDGEDYVLAFLTPPSKAASSRQPAREIVFVIDNSGSMGGESMRQAKASLVYALGRLKPADRFNVVRFDDTMETLFADTVSADGGNVKAAQDFVKGLEASGGTEMLPAMRAALADPRPTDERYIRQVVFLTDGEIGNDQELLEAVGQGKGRSRVFMVGIGSAPNSFLMTRASEIGRGTFTHIGSTAQVETRMRELFTKLEQPVATELTATLNGVTSDITPAVLPDLYRGEPVVVAAKVSELKGAMTIAGLIDGKPWSIDLALAKAVPGQGISKLWARREITDAEVARTLRQLSDERADARILEVALAHKLVSSQTSLVAVDRTPSRPEGTPLVRADLPLNLPAGWDFDALFGDTVRHAKAGGAELAENGLDLPQTATDAELRLWSGLALAILGSALMIFVLRRRPGEAA